MNADENAARSRCPARVKGYGRLAKNARTASAVFAPTAAASSSRVARRTPARLPNVVSSVLRRRAPTPGTSSSSERRSRIVRARRWNVTAKRCASSRIRWISSSAGSCVRQRDRILVLARVEQLLLLRDADGDEVREPELLERRIRRRQLSLAAVDQHQIRKRPAVLEQLAVAAQHDFVHRREVVLRRGRGWGWGLAAPWRSPAVRALAASPSP